MSSFDQTIAGDLAALSAENRIGIPPLGTMLPTPAASGQAAGIDIALLAAAQVYVRRFAGAAAGASATLCVVALLVWLSNPFGLIVGPRIHTVVDHIVYAGPVEAAFAFTLIVLATHAVARRIADHRVAYLIARAPLNALAQLRTRAGAMAGLAAGLHVAGTASVTIALGISWVAIGTERYSVFWESARDFPVLELMHHAIIAAVLGALAAATVIAFMARCATTRASRGLAHPAVTAFGVTLGVVTVLVGLRLDVGPWFETFVAAAIPSTALRVVLTITGSLAVVLVVASAALRRDQRQKRSTAP